MRNIYFLFSCWLGACSLLQAGSPPAPDTLQATAERVLAAGGYERAAIVVVDCTTGELVALADASPGERPTAATAVTPAYTIAPFMAYAALESGTITPETRVNCPGMIHINGHPFNEWKAEGFGPLTVTGALNNSSGNFFRQTAIRTGAEPIAATLRRFGFGQPTQLVAEEEAGVVPDPDWLKKHHPRERWTTATTANLSTGMGYLTATPLQMARAYAALANPSLRVDLEPRATTVETLHQALRGNVTDGAARNAQPGEGPAVAGQSGTGQGWRWHDGRNVKALKGWFCGYVPAESPRYAFAILVDGSHSQAAKQLAQALWSAPSDANGE